MGFPSYFENIVERLLAEQEALAAQLYEDAPSSEPQSSKPKRRVKPNLPGSIEYHFLQASQLLEELLLVVTDPTYSNASIATEYNRLKRELPLLREALSKKEAELKVLRQAHSKLSQRFTAFGRSDAPLLEDYTRLQLEVPELRKKIAHQAGHISRLREDLLKVQEENAELRRENVRLTKVSKSLRQGIGSRSTLSSSSTSSEHCTNRK